MNRANVFGNHFWLLTHNISLAEVSDTGNQIYEHPNQEHNIVPNLY